MSMSSRIGAYLDSRNIRYDTLNHYYTNSSLDTAVAAKIPLKSIAKAVVLEDHEGHHLMAILPANKKIALHKLENDLNVGLHLVEEGKVYEMFNDCDPGAVPAIGNAYNMDSIYDDLLEGLSDIYLESGNHKTLIHLDHSEFKKLMVDTRSASFSRELFH